MSNEEPKGENCSICGECTDNVVQHVMDHFETSVENCKNCNSDRFFQDFDEYKLHKKLYCLNHPHFNTDVIRVQEKFNCYRKERPRPTFLEDNNTSNSNLVNPAEENTLTEKLQDCNIIFNGVIESAPQTIVHQIQEMPEPALKADKLPWSDQDPVSSDSEDFYKTGLNGCRTSRKIKPLEKPNLYLCEICGKSYKVYKHLKEHLYQHNDFYSCETCKKRFPNPSRLQLHVQRDHIYSSDHVCEVCGKTFCHEKFLRRHIKRHEKILMYPCDVCKKRFFSSYALKSHMRQHTDEKPFRCGCGESFRHNVLLKAHKKSKHGITEEKTIPCTVCNKLFGSRFAIYSHMRTHNK